MQVALVLEASEVYVALAVVILNLILAGTLRRVGEGCDETGEDARKERLESRNGGADNGNVDLEA
jgi:hypothetical protein